MKIDYQLEEKDYIQFNLFQIQDSNKIKKKLTRQRITLSILFIVIALLSFFNLNRFPLIVGGIFLGMAIIWYLIFPSFAKRQVVRSTKKTIASGRLANLFDEVQLVLNHEGVREIRSQGEFVTNWEDIDRINIQNDYVYLFITESLVIIIPRRVMNQDEFKQFKNQMNTYYSNSIKELNGNYQYNKG